MPTAGQTHSPRHENPNSILPVIPAEAGIQAGIQGLKSPSHTGLGSVCLWGLQSAFSSLSRSDAHLISITIPRTVAVPTSKIPAAHIACPVWVKKATAPVPQAPVPKTPNTMATSNILRFHVSILIPYKQTEPTGVAGSDCFSWSTGSPTVIAIVIRQSTSCAGVGSNRK